MNNDGIHEHIEVTKLPNRIYIFLSGLVEPGSGYKNSDDHRRAKLLSSIIIAVLPIMVVVGFILVPLVDIPIFKSGNIIYITSYAVGISIISYLLNRSGYFQVAGALYIFMLMTASLAATITNFNLSTISFGTISIGSVLLSSVLFSNIYIPVLVAIAVVGSTLLIPLIVPGTSYENIIALATANILLSTLILIYSSYRNKLEIIRTDNINKLNTELESQNSELERFTYTVSHDLKSPLITIRGFMGMLQNDVVAGDAARIESDVLQINGAVDQMERLLTDLLDLSRLGRVINPEEEINLNELIDTALNLVSGQIDSGGVEVDIQPNLPRVYGDQTRLLEVFQNLIENAAKYMGDQSEPRIQIGIKTDGKSPVYFVSDNGIGIDTRYHKKIFGLFERLDSQGAGTGIGLALVKRIIELHDGRIWVESDGRGKGSAFRFTLPQDK